MSRPKRRNRVLTWLERALWSLAVVCLGWVGWSYSDAFLYQQWADATFEDAIAATAPSAAVASTADFEAAEGEPVARVRIPRLDLSVVVAEGTTDGVLRRAAGRMSVSAPPGSDGNVVVAAHRDSYFRPLEHVEIGDEVMLDGPAGSDVYTVEWTRVVDPSALEVTADPGYPALTLVTCYPFRYLGSAPQRFIVRARRTRHEARQTVDGAADVPPTRWIGDAS
jgi:sortase A